MSNNLIPNPGSYADVSDQVDFDSAELKDLIETAYCVQTDMLERKMVTEEVLNMNFTV